MADSVINPSNAARSFIEMTAAKVIEGIKSFCEKNQIAKEPNYHEISRKLAEKFAENIVERTIPSLLPSIGVNSGEEHDLRAEAPSFPKSFYNENTGILKADKVAAFLKFLTMTDTRFDPQIEHPFNGVDYMLPDWFREKERIDLSLATIPELKGRNKKFNKKIKQDLDSFTIASLYPQETATQKVLELFTANPDFTDEDLDAALQPRDFNFYFKDPEKLERPHREINLGEEFDEENLDSGQDFSFGLEFNSKKPAKAIQLSLLLNMNKMKRDVQQNRYAPISSIVPRIAYMPRINKLSYQDAGKIIAALDRYVSKKSTAFKMQENDWIMKFKQLHPLPEEE